MLFLLLFCLGAVFAAAINVFVDRHGWFSRYRSPWRRLPTDEDSHEIQIDKKWYDFLPIVGWLSWKRVATCLEKIPEQKRPHGLGSKNFWIQPFCVELFAAVGTPLLYHWEVHLQMLLPTGVRPEPWETLVTRFFVHLLLFGLLLAASLIDLDDMIIPDVLTVTGTVLGLALAILLPQTALPSKEVEYMVIYDADPDLIRSIPVPVKTVPNAVPLNSGSPHSVLHAYGNFDRGDRRFYVLSALWIFWCFAMMNRVWYTKLPVKKAGTIFLRKLWRTPSTKWYILAAVLLPLLLSTQYHRNSVPAYHVSLSSALVGMACGMILIWSVRLIGRFVLGREAMGFGDVTLMGMIGAFVGWQSCILIFFLAPFAGLVLGILNAVGGRGREFPYGPFLCLATVLLLVFWSPIWEYVSPLFEVPGLILAVMALCGVLLGVLLWAWCWGRERLFSGNERSK